MNHIRTLSKKNIVLLLAAGVFLFLGGTAVWAVTIGLPDLSNFEARKIANSSKILDRTGEVVLYDIHQSVRRTEIPLSEMGDTIKNATLAIEDENFYTHNGIRPTSIVRAMIVNIREGSFSQGGSTITQQIIKNTLLNTDKTVTRKIKEWVLALKLERQFSKDDILQIYLNDNPYGGTIYGIEEASQAFLSKHAKDLTIAEAAYMAAIPKAPTYYSPFGKNKDKLETRKNVVLKKMHDLKYISDEEYEEAKKEVVVFNTQAQNSIKAPHFVFYVLDYLQQKYGEDVMETGGYTITTTLDYELQQKAEEVVKANALQNTKSYNATNSSLVALDPTTGQIISMVGSRDYFDKEIDGAFNVATAQRQPGSSFKPFVYAAGFLKGYTADTVLFDVPTEFSTTCANPTGFSEADNCYNPKNFDGEYKGPLKIRNALAESRNVPAVKMMYLVGLTDAISLAKELGISTLREKAEYGLSLVLGGGEATLLDMTSAYGVFAHSGVRNTPTGILSVVDRKGNEIEVFEKNEKQVLDKNVALTINDILADPQARIPTFGSGLTIQNVAFKTGTTNDNRDAWIIGYSPTLSVGVWSGNNDNKAMRGGGSAISGPTWKAFMNEAIKKYPHTAFEKPLVDSDYQSLKPVLRGVWLGSETVWIDKITGERATENTPLEAREERVITNVQDILYSVDKSNPRGPRPTNPYSDPQFRLWDMGVQQWWQANKYRYNITTPQDLPTSYETIHTDSNKPLLGISGLPSQMKQNDQVTITITNQNQFPLTGADIFIDNNYVTSLSSPFRFVFEPKEYGYLPGTYSFSVRGVNTIYATATKEQIVTITQ